MEPFPDVASLLRFLQEIVAQGFAFPSNGERDLENALAGAKLRRAGIWHHAACIAAAHSC
jgi:hypothetical protein